MPSKYVKRIYNYEAIQIRPVRPGYAKKEIYVKEWDRWLTHDDMVIEPTCSVSKAMLRSRLSRLGYRLGSFETVLQCIEAPRIPVRGRLWKGAKAPKPPVNNDLTFLDILGMFKPGSLRKKALIMQSRPVRARVWGI